VKSPGYCCVGDWLSDGQAVISRSDVWLLDGDPNGIGYDRVYSIPRAAGLQAHTETKRPCT
jgi:hypothetical protein